MHAHLLPAPWECIPVFTNWLGIDFSIEHVVNRGAAWGLFASWQVLLLCVRLLVVAGLIVYLCAGRCVRAQEAPFVAIISGALGNIFDFFLYGHVVDMFHFTFWGYSFPVFNVADSAIFCGVAAMLLINMWMKRKGSLKSAHETAL